MYKTLAQMPYFQPVIIGDYSKCIKHVKNYIESQDNKSKQILTNAKKMLITPENLGKADLRLPLEGYQWVLNKKLVTVTAVPTYDSNYNLVPVDTSAAISFNLQTKNQLFFAVKNFSEPNNCTEIYRQYASCNMAIVVYSIFEKI